MPAAATRTRSPTCRRHPCGPDEQRARVASLERRVIEPSGARSDLHAHSCVACATLRPPVSIVLRRQGAKETAFLHRVCGYLLPLRTIDDCLPSVRASGGADLHCTAKLLAEVLSKPAALAPLSASLRRGRDRFVLRRTIRACSVSRGSSRMRKLHVLATSFAAIPYVLFAVGRAYRGGSRRGRRRSIS